MDLFPAFILRTTTIFVVVALRVSIGGKEMSVQDAKAHLDEAMRFLSLEAWRGQDLDSMERVDDFTIAEELERIDRALGPKGKSMFAALGDNVRSAYVEIKAARQALSNNA